MVACTYTYEADFKPGLWDLNDPASFANGVLCMEIDVEIKCTGACKVGYVGCKTPKDNDADLMICVDITKVFPEAEFEDCLKALADVKTLSDVRTARSNECEKLFDMINDEEDSFDPVRHAKYVSLRDASLLKAVKETGWCVCTPVATHSRNLRPDTPSVIANNHKEDIQKRYLSKI
tara:strand:- start:339 stop:869 length:531 start_codon:yes stop_codon:yes gene_type:complete